MFKILITLILTKNRTRTMNFYQTVIILCIFIIHCFLYITVESLVTLANSLSSSPLSRSHIPVLFYIAGIGYHWVKEGSLFSPQFRTGELILLQVRFSTNY